MRNKISIQNSKIISNRRIKKQYYEIIIRSPQIAASAKPGQFLQVKINNSLQPFLRRPFSIHQVNRQDITILYEVKGTGTQLLSKFKPGEYLDVIGPLGNGFSYSRHCEPLTRSVKGEAISEIASVAPAGLPRNDILVAGGMGTAPLVFLAEKLKKVEGRRSKVEGLVFLGAKTRGLILCEKEFRDLGYEVKVATDDGSKGFKGKITELLKTYFAPSSQLPAPSSIYACGPRPMLQEISRISRGHKIPAQVSLEEHMACGIGACLGCVVNTKNGYRRVCKDGPVFEADEIIWE